MATNNLPDLNKMLMVEFNPQVLYDTLLKMQREIDELKDKVKELEDASKN